MSKVKICIKYIFTRKGKTIGYYYTAQMNYEAVGDVIQRGQMFKGHTGEDIIPINFKWIASNYLNELEVLDNTVPKIELPKIKVDFAVEKDNFRSTQAILETNTYILKMYRTEPIFIRPQKFLGADNEQTIESGKRELENILYNDLIDKDTQYPLIHTKNKDFIKAIIDSKESGRKLNYYKVILVPYYKRRIDTDLNFYKTVVMRLQEQRKE